MKMNERNHYDGPERRESWLSATDIEAVAVKAAHHAVAETFRLLGVDIKDQSSVNEFRADLVHIRMMRRLLSRGGLIAFTVMMTAISTGAIAVMWQAIFPGHKQ